MTARPRPWMKFSPDRWRNDEALRMCGAAARGVWMELICIMHKAEPYGHLLVRGKQPSDRQLAVMTGLPVLELSAALAELEANEVFSRADDGTIFSRGMVRDEELHAKASELGAKGAARRYQKGNDKSGPHRGADRGPHSRPQGDPHNLESESEGESEKNPPVVPQGTKTRIPDDWGPVEFGAETQSRRIVDAWDQQRFAAEVEAFRAHHRTAQSRYSDWQATWSTWVLNTERFDRGKPRATPAAPRTHADIVLAEIARERPQNPAEPGKKRAGVK